MYVCVCVWQRAVEGEGSKTQPLMGVGRHCQPSLGEGMRTFMALIPFKSQVIGSQKGQEQ